MGDAQAAARANDDALARKDEEIARLQAELEAAHAAAAEEKEVYAMQLSDYQQQVART